MKLHRVCGKWRQIPVTAGDKWRQVAATLQPSLRQIAASLLPPFAATCRVLSGRIFAFRTRKGMVSNKITGFPIPESRHKSSSPERMKLDDGWSH
ncbi:MAG: hypothetical protein WCS94_06830 [Verrucomicrobiota bacterium]